MPSGFASNVKVNISKYTKVRIFVTYNIVIESDQPFGTVVNCREGYILFFIILTNAKILDKDK